MSVLTEVKGIILSHLRKDIEPELKEAVFDVINAVDSDLDNVSYEPSTDVEEAVEDLNKVLGGITEDEDTEVSKVGDLPPSLTQDDTESETGE